MRNLKRALSLALASVMLLGMMVVGSSATSIDDFSDVDEINNKEAVAIATGLGIFDGYDDGEFKPENVVTRAEMAVVIAKILHGSDVDPSNFAGAGKFTDVPAWAEGYVNLVASLKIIEGYGDGKFGPNDPVTTVQASTMLLKALGYFVDDATALGSDWQLQVTSKATALGLYGDLSLGMNAGLTRENVAELTFNALFAQRVAYDDYRGLYVKASDRNVVVTNGTVDEYNTLAQNTYGLYCVEGTVIANGKTDMYLDGKTLVVFDDEKDVTGDNIVEDEYKFETETGLDMIGHATKVYYKIVKKAPVVYAIVDDATLAVETLMTDNLSNLAKAEGFAKDTSETKVVYNYDLENDVTKGYKAYEDEIVYLISNSSDLTVDYAIVVESELSYVKDIIVNDADEDDPILTYTLIDPLTLDDDKNVIALNDVEEEDYVLTTLIAGRGINGTDLYLIETADTEIETIVTVTRKYDDTTKLASEAIEYVKSVTDITAKLADGVAEEGTAVIAYADVLMEGEYILVYDNAGRLIGVVPVVVDSTVNAAYVAQFGVKINTDPTLFDKYALYAHVYFADGTNGVYTVDTSEFSGNAFWGTAITTVNGSAVDTSFTFKDTTNLSVSSVVNVPVIENSYQTVNNMNHTNGEGYGEFVRLYDVTVRDNGKIRIKELPGQGVEKNSANEWVVCDTIANAQSAVSASLSQIKKGVTWMGVVSADAKDSFYGNSKTTFFFVEGVYDDGIDVDVITGIANVPTVDLPNDTITNSDIADDATIGQAAATDKTGYKAVDYVLVNGYDFVEEIEGLYFYNGIYTIKDMKDGTYDLTFKAYDFETGEVTYITYEGFDSDKDARDVAEELENGYYTMGTTASDALEAYYAYVNSALVNDVANGDDNTYVVDVDFVRFIDQGDVLTMYTSNNNYRGGVTVTEDTIFVDLTGNKLTSLETMNRLIEARQKIWEQNGQPNTTTATLSYDIDAKNNVGVIYVTSIIGEYDKDYTGTGSGTTDPAKAVTLDKSGYVQANFIAEKYVATLYEYSPYQGKWIAVDTAESDGSVPVKFDLVPNYRYQVIVNGIESNIVLAEANEQ